MVDPEPIACSVCGALLKDPVLHEEWHGQLRMDMQRASTGGSIRVGRAGMSGTKL